MLCSGLSVNADDSNGGHELVPIQPGLQTLKGEDLLNFLMTNYAVVVGYSNTYDDFNGATWLDENEYEFQFVYDNIGDNVYFTLSFPKVNGITNPMAGKYYIIKFMSMYTTLNGYPQFNIYSMNTTVYKRFFVRNGDATDGDSVPFYSFSIGVKSTDGSYENTYKVDTDEGSLYVPFDFPLLNQSSVVDSNGVTINPWINEADPYQKNSSGAYKMQSYYSVPLLVDYYVTRDDGYLDVGLLDLALVYTSGNTYNGGAVQFCITPITIGVSEKVEDPYLNMTPEHEEQVNQNNGLMSDAGGFLKDQSSTLGGYSQFVDSGTDRPNIDMSYLLNLDNIGRGGLSGGITAFITGSTPLFHENAFFNTFFILAAPPLIIGYLLFGKK